jgi:ABC-type cobalamin/Fe3+-siderophores transport system ATPase subunit
MIEADGLGMRYPSGRLALDGASLTVAAGELVVILGHNGSGKSTLLRCTAGILKPTSGRVRLLGRDINQLSGRALREARLVVALPMAILAARNTTPARVFYAAARGVIGLCRSVPDLIWALLFVTAVGLG